MITGVLTITAALAYGELAAMMPRAGGQYVYLREAYSPLWGFLYGWTLFMVIQTGTIAAVAVAFARFAGMLVPCDCRGPLPHSAAPRLDRLRGLAVDRAAARRGPDRAPDVDEHARPRIRQGHSERRSRRRRPARSSALILVGRFRRLERRGRRRRTSANFWQPRGFEPIADGVSAATAFGIFVALCVSQTGSLFSADAWNNITFTAGEVKDPHRNIPLSLAFGTHHRHLALPARQRRVPVDASARTPFSRRRRIASRPRRLEAIFPGAASALMAVAIMISTFGCNNGLILAGARAYYAMARDGLFFARAGQLNAARVPAWGLGLQGIWAALLVLPRTYNPATQQYGNLYGNLLDYVVSAALLFYILTIAGVFRLRATRPDAPRPYRAFGYPVSAGAVHRRGAGDPARAAGVPSGDHVARVSDRAAGDPGFAWRCAGA